MRTLLVLMVLLIASVPLGSAQGGLVPFPRAGELFYYVGVAGQSGEEEPAEKAVRFLGVDEAVDRWGARGPSYVVETVTPSEGFSVNGDHAPPAFHGDVDALLADPESVRLAVHRDLATFDAIEARRAAASAGAYEGLPADPLQLVVSEYRFSSLRREYFDRGLPDPYAALWGRPLPREAVTLHWPQGNAGGMFGSAWATEALEVTGLMASTVEAPRSQRMPFAAEVRLEPVGAATEAGRAVSHYRGSFGYGLAKGAVDVTLDLWLAPDLAAPVRERVERHVVSGESTWDQVVDLTLAEHRPGRAELPWGEHPRAGSFTGETGSFDRWGPAGGAGLRIAYPLRDAVDSVRADPTLTRFQRLEAAGDPVLVKAFYEVREEVSLERPLKEARWWLVFHDAGSEELVIESKRPLGMPVPVSYNKELRERNVYMVPDIEGVRPAELPVQGPTLAGAMRAWRAFGPEAAPPANAFYYSLQRMHEGQLLPILWAGTTASRTDPVPPVEDRRSSSMVAVDADGLPRLSYGGEQVYTSDLEPLATSGAGPAPPPVQGSDAPALAAAGLGVAAAAGILAHLLGPFYSRLDRSQLLGHPTRRALLALVERQPGIPLEAAQRALGVGAGSAAHHLAMLHRAGLVQVLRAGRFRRLYPPGTAAAEVARDAALRPPRAAALYQLVKQRPGVGLREAARQLGVPASSLQWHVARLARAGVVERRGSGLHPRAA